MEREKKIWEEKGDGERGKEKKGRGKWEKRKGEGLFLWRSDEKVKGAGFELV